MKRMRTLGLIEREESMMNMMKGKMHRSCTLIWAIYLDFTSIEKLITYKYLN
jgi:hypothetical protein